MSHSRRRALPALIVALAAGSALAAEKAEMVTRISSPSESSMLRANVPVFGTAWAKDFDSYRLEFGEGREPKKWVLIKKSRQPQTTDPYAQGKVVWNRDWGATTGNLGRWEVGLDEYPYGQKFKHNLRGEYTLRLVVRDRKGRTAQHAIVVVVARALTNTHAGFGLSPDELVRFDVPANALEEAFRLVAILPVEEGEAQKGLMAVAVPQELVRLSKIYEFRPPGLSLIRPGTLSFKFEAGKLGTPTPQTKGKKIAANQVAIHAHDPVEQKWVALPTKVDLENGTASTRVREVQRYLAYYALLADVTRPGTPELDKLPERSQTRLLEVSGDSEAGSQVALSLTRSSGVHRRTVVCGEEGRFEAEIELLEGANTLTAHCVDRTRNRSRPTPAQRIVLEYGHPKKVKEVKVIVERRAGSDGVGRVGREARTRRERRGAGAQPPHQKGGKALGAKEAARGDRLWVEVVGEDASPERDTTLVRVATSKTDAEGIVLEAAETDRRSGRYRASVEIGAATDASEGRIAAKADGERIVAVWPGWEGDGSPGRPGASAGAQSASRSEDKGDSPKTPVPFVRGDVVYRDRVPPSAPTIECVGSPALCWNSFETDEAALLKQWRALDGPAGAAVSIESEGRNRFMRMESRLNQSGHLGVIAWSGAYTVSAHPVVAFDFRARPKTEVDLLVNVATPKVGWKGVKLTDGSPYFARLGAIHDVEADGQWHRAEVNVLRLLRERFASGHGDGSPGQGKSPKSSQIGPRAGAETASLKTPVPSDYVIKHIAFADWDGGDRLFGTKHFGKSADRRCSYDVDNFAITRYDNVGRVTFKWSAADESGIDAWSYLLDHDSGTMAPESDVTTTPEKTFSRLADGRWWFHVRARDKCGNWGPTSHFLYVVDTEPPRVKAITPMDRPPRLGSPVCIHLSDVGAGVDPTSCRLRVDGRCYRVNGSTLTFDRGPGTLAFWPQLVKPYPTWFVDGFPLRVELTGVADYAGGFVKEAKTWQVPVSSPVVLTDGDSKRSNGWCTQLPRVGLKPKDRDRWTLAWLRALKGDKYAKRGSYIREIALLKREGQPEATTNPERLAMAKGPTYYRGGLVGRYYRKPDFNDLICERVDPFVHFHTEPGRYTPPVDGARSAVWEGALYVPTAMTTKLELALWGRAPAKGRVLIDGEAVLELGPKYSPGDGYQKREVPLGKGLRRLRLELTDPSDRMWQFVFFRWDEKTEGQGVQHFFGPDELYCAKAPGTDGQTIPIHDGAQPPVFVAEVKVDTSTPRTRIATATTPASKGSRASTKIILSHSEHAYRRGGLRGRYYRGKNLTDLICERVDPFVYFSDDREQFTPPVAGAHSAVWVGGLYVSRTQRVELEVAIWQRGAASGRVSIDGEAILSLAPQDMVVAGFQKQAVLLTRGMHELRLEFREPSSLDWSFALFRWYKGAQGEDAREVLSPQELYYPEDLGTTYYHWNDGPRRVYTRPLIAPPGKSVLRFYTVDRAGHVEPEQRREVRVPAADPERETAASKSRPPHKTQ